MKEVLPFFTGWEERAYYKGIERMDARTALPYTRYISLEYASWEFFLSKALILIAIVGYFQYKHRVRMYNKFKNLRPHPNRLVRAEHYSTKNMGFL